MPVVSEFRTILKEVRELGAKIGTSSNEQLSKEVEEIKDSVTIIEGNHSAFADEMFRRLDAVRNNIEAAVSTAVTPLVQRITELEEKLDSFMSSSNQLGMSTPPSASRKRTPRIPDLSHHVRNKLSALGFEWDTTKKENDPVNKKVAESLLREVLEIEDVKTNRLCTTRRIEAAISSTFQTAKKKRKREEEGLEEIYKEKSRKQSRSTRKIKRRKDMLREEEKAEKLASALHPSLISSEESDGETIVIRPLKWRNGEVNSFFKKLDKRWFDGLSAQQKRQLAKRENGQNSKRNNSLVPQELHWALTPILYSDTSEEES